MDLENNDFVSKVQHQINCSSFKEPDMNNSKNFEEKVISWMSKWTLKGVINSNWKWFITPAYATPAKMYGIVKTHKVSNPVSVLSNGCNIAIDILPIYTEHIIY